MKKLPLLLLAAIMICTLLSVPALALSAPTTDGIWLTGKSSAFTVTPCDASGSPITMSSGYDLNGDGMAEGFYEGAARLTVKYTPTQTGLRTGDNYVIVMHTGPSIGVDSILYIDQVTVTTADVSAGYLLFDVYPPSMQDAVIKITSDSSGFSNPLTVVNVHRYLYYVLGDTDEDGSITTMDAVKVLQYLVHSISFTENQLCAADTNRDGQVTAQDATRILQYFVGTISAF